MFAFLLFFFEFTLFIRNPYTVLVSVLFVTCLFMYFVVFRFYSCSNTRYSLRSIFFCYSLVMCVYVCAFTVFVRVCCIYIFKWCAVVIDRIAIFCLLLTFS